MRRNGARCGAVVVAASGGGVVFHGAERACRRIIQDTV